MEDLFLSKCIERNWDVVEKFFLVPNPQMGDFISCVGPWMFPTEEEGLRRIRKLVKHKIHFEMDGCGEGSGLEVVWPTKKLAEKIRAAGGKYLADVMCHLELGGMCYWPRHYYADPEGKLSKDPDVLFCCDWKFPYARRMMLGAKDMADAKERFVSLAKRAERGRRKVWGHTPLRCTDSCMYAKYIYEAGFDYAGVEIFPSSEPLMLMSAYRGATRGLGKKLWAAHIVIEWYAGFRDDELRRRRWPVSLYLAFLLGCNMPYSEGHSFNDYDKDMYAVDGIREQFYDKKYASYRNVWKKFVAFAKAKDNERPAGGPIARVGILHGNLDGYLGIWETRVWGQFHSPEWEYGPAEWGWEYFNAFFRRTPWHESTAYGDEDYSGNPPMGQVDIVPIECDLKALQRYSCLLMLGWNTMTPDVYKKLLAYVRGGGHLIATVAHMRTNIRRDEDLDLIHGGDFSDLFGIEVSGKAEKETVGCRFVEASSIPGYEFPVWSQLKWFKDPEVMSGPIPLAQMELRGARSLAFAAEGGDALYDFPVLVEHKAGKGTALLLTTWCYPGEPNMKELMGVMVRNIVAGEQGPVRFVGSDRIRFAWYRKGKGLRGYFLNTDLNNKESGTILYRARRLPITLGPCRIKVVDL